MCGHHKTVETILHHQNPKKAALRLPTCTQIHDPRTTSGGKQPGEQVSFLALAYGWEDYARQYPMSKEESHLRWDRGFCLFGSQHLGLMQLLLEYGVHPASAIEGLLPKLVCTLDMAAVELLQGHHLDIGERQLSDGRTMLHLLVSFRSCKNRQPSGYNQDQERHAAQTMFNKQVKEWQDLATPLLQLLLASPRATLRQDNNNKTAMDICRPEYNQFLSAMNNARLSVQPVHRANSDSEQRQCVVCMDRESSVVIIPCGHLCVCQPCSSCCKQLCPVCRGAITQMVQTYTP